MWYRNLVFIATCCIATAGLCFYIAPQQLSMENGEASDGRQRDDDDIVQLVESVDDEFRALWQEQGLTPTPPADDLTIARRLSLALAGTIPSLEDLRRLETIDEAQRVGWWTKQLLADRRHADYFAERLARAYVGVDEGPFIIYRRRRFVSWLSDQLHANTPYDQLVQQLITADGLWTDAPEVNFLTANANDEDGNRPDPIRMAGRTTRAFLGFRLDCMQCHDDNLGGEWLQSDFHQLAAFYNSPKQTLVGIRDEDRPYMYKYLDDDEETDVSPGVPFATNQLSESGSNRARLAKWVTHADNKSFARAIVNRVWALAFGRPLVQPVDNIPLEGPYPPGLDLLAEDFVQHGYDLDRLWRAITATEPFRRDSRSDEEITFEHEEHWASFPVTRLRPEQVAGAIVQSAKLTTIDASSHIIVRAIRAAQVNDFVQRYGDMGEDEFDASGGTIPQRLLMLNGELVKEVTKDDMVINAATRIAELAPSNAEAIKAAYMAVLTREPTDTEQDYFLERLEQSDQSQRAFFEDLYCVLFNSTEFSWNH